MKTGSISDLAEQFDINARTIRLYENNGSFGSSFRGYINEFSAGRLLRDAKLYEIGAGTSEIRRMLIGRELFKETG